MMELYGILFTFLSLWLFSYLPFSSMFYLILPASVIMYFFIEQGQEFGLSHEDREDDKEECSPEELSNIVNGSILDRILKQFEDNKEEDEVLLTYKNVKFRITKEEISDDKNKTEKEE